MRAHARRSIALIVTLSVFLLASCGGDDETGSSESTSPPATADTGQPTTSDCPADGDDTPVKVGVLLEETGVLAGYTAIQKDLIDNITKLPGRDTILCRPVEIILRDDQSDATAGIAAMRRLIDVDQVDVVIGPALANVGAAVIPIAMEAEVLYFSMTGNCPSPECGAGPYAFTLEHGRPSHAETMVGRLEELGITSVPTVHALDPSSEGFQNALQEAAEEAGIDTSSSVVSFQAGTLDLSSQVAELKATGSDTIVMIGVGNPTDQITLLKAMDEANFHPKILGNAGLALPAVFSELIEQEPDWVDTWEASGYAPNMMRPVPEPVMTWADQLRDLIGAEKVNSNGVRNYDTFTDSYDAFKFLAEATGSLDGPTLAEYLIENGYSGLKGEYEFTETDHEGLTPEMSGTARPGSLQDGFLDQAG